MTKVNKISVMLIAAIAAASILSCTKEENAATGNHAIGFRSNDVWTKAMVLGEDGLKNGGFHVYAQGTFDGTGGTYRFDRHVTFTDGGWNYKNLEYWLPTCSYVFRAYYPADLPVSKTGDAIQGFELESQYGTQTDVLMATASKKTSEIKNEEDKTVKLTFMHLLTRLDVKLRVEESDVDEDEDGKNDPKIKALVKAVAFRGVAQKADYNSVEGWKNLSGAIAIGGNITEELNTTGVSMFKNGLLAIPQNVDSDVTLFILTDITLPNGNVIEKQFDLKLPASNWTAGSSYIYTALLSENFNITFNEPKVESWGDEQMDGVDGIVIIK